MPVAGTEPSAPSHYLIREFRGPTVRLRSPQRSLGAPAVGSLRASAASPERRTRSPPRQSLYSGAHEALAATAPYSYARFGVRMEFN